MAEAEELQRNLLASQNADGGWAYGHGSSWTEPTAFALLALESQDYQGAAYDGACEWLRTKQKADGGWTPHPSVNVSTWVTSLAFLALSDQNLTGDNRHRAINWILGQVQPELNPLERFWMHHRGVPPGEETRGGSPWFPGTAAWIGPTVMSVLALSYAISKHDDQKLRDYVRHGREYILSRRCADGGWNHGGTRFRSQNAESYPEMTGMALLALRGDAHSELDRSIALAEKYGSAPTSIEGLSWLELGLLAHGQDHRGIMTDLPCRTSRDICLRILALADPPSDKLLNNC